MHMIHALEVQRRASSAGAWICPCIARAVRAPTSPDGVTRFCTEARSAHSTRCISAMAAAGLLTL